jgi:hypothetical protein
MIDLKTTRYSTVVAAFVERYPDAEARLDKRRVAGPVGVVVHERRVARSRGLFAHAG